VDDAPTLEQLKAELTDVTLQVHLAEERKDERDLVAAAHAGVERLAQRYRALIASLSPGEQLSVERALGRRVVDLKRLASLLPKVPGASSGSTPDRAAGGGVPEGRRITGVSWSHERGAPKAGKVGVGADVESWCGRCADLTTHSIVAMVGNEAKQVLCQVCGSRHTHRTVAARRTATGASTTSAGETEERGRPVDPETKRKAAELRALGEEVAASTEVRAFDPKERYKAGEIISHPEYGRGKVQNVLRSSLLVRFSVGGLKSLMLR
jgi:hypothetical protein